MGYAHCSRAVAHAGGTIGATAERQVRLQRSRVWISLTAALIALATLLVTLRPWKLFSTPDLARAAGPVGGDDSG